MTTRMLFLAALAAGCTTQDHGHDRSAPDAGIVPTGSDDAGSGSATDAAPPPDLTCPTGTCADPSLYCDADGFISGTPHSCIAVSCTPKQFDTCDGDATLTCNAAGTGYDLASCEHGCNPERGCNFCTPDTKSCLDGIELITCGADGQEANVEGCDRGCIDAPAPHCAHIQPRYLPNACDADASAQFLDVVTDLDLDTDDAATCTGGIVAQAGGPSICVVHYGIVTVETGATLRAHGTNALAVVSDSQLKVKGKLDVSAHGTTSGPGGGFTTSGGGVLARSGAGGAGFHTAGGNGGSVTIDGGAHDSGAASADPVGVSTLAGGPRGGGTNGGGGGGGAMLISCKHDVLLDSVLVTGGGGGAIGGNGGGAGGYVVVQGFDVGGFMQEFANGGGGGGGAGAAGADATASTTQAAGGAGKFGGGSGGNGAVAGQTGGPGTHPTSTTLGAGGGGGGTGFFQTYTPPGVTPVTNAGFQPNANVIVR